MESKFFELPNQPGEFHNSNSHDDVPSNDESTEIEALRRRIADLERELQHVLKLNRDGEAMGARIWQVADSALHAVVLVDRQGAIRQMNAQAEKLFGYSAGDLSGHSVEELIPEDSRARHPQLRNDYFARPTVRPVGVGRDLYGLRKDGTQVPVEIGLSPVLTEHGTMVICSILDISVRQRAEDRFRLVVESSPNAIVMVNHAGEIVLVNLQAEQMFGYLRSELIGRPVEILVPDSFRATHSADREYLFTAPVARPMGRGRDLRGRRKDGTEFPVEVGLTPIDSDEGVYVLSAIVDITERVQADKRRQLHLTELAHAARLSAVGEMFAELAHEINQPLGATANYTRACVRMLKSSEPVPPAQLREWLEKAAAQAVRATEIVQRIGSFVRRGGPIQANLDINEVIEHVLALPVLDIWAGGTMQRITPVMRLAKDLPVVMADRVQIEQVLLNLLRNSLDAMLALPPDDRRILIETALEGTFVRVSVEDNGVGLTPEARAHVFTPFFTTKANGMGLGLSISKSIIEAHSGTLTVESIPKAGARFSFTLPVFSLQERI